MLECNTLFERIKMSQKWTLLKKWDDVVKGSPEIQQLPERSMKMNILNISDKIAITNEKNDGDDDIPTASAFVTSFHAFPRLPEFYSVC